MSDNSLVCKDLVKAYGHNEVLHSVNLEIEKGKIYGFIGRNGAGKTTLLSVASGQNPATNGEITVNGMPVWENQEARDIICFSRELNPMNGNGANTTKVKDYLKAAAIYMPKFDKAYADELVKAFGLDTKKRISKLSKGMMSMVTIIVALASKADYTFL
ncbi:MAG: ATP-binding cassette domain-containing protein, partial [Lachnospiraceae bacterium]|nr:ATP-binding cassette domain-containing protein [Lachnospiraceae bacterium]